MSEIDPAPAETLSVAGMVSGDAWHTQAPAAALRSWRTCPHNGLDAAEVSARRARWGANRLPGAARRPAWRRFLLQFHNPLIYVLLAAGTVTLALGGTVDALVILAVVLVNALIGHVQEGRAEQALEAVRSMLPSRTTVLRGGERALIDACDLVPGDLVLLEAGDQVPADLRLVEARNLRCIEAALTGESAPVAKALEAVEAGAALGDRTCMCYAGTLVGWGQARGLVVATGTRTEIGRIGALVSEVQGVVTPLTRRLDQFARQVTGFILVTALITLVYGHYVARMPLYDLFLAVVGLAVAAIPEGMPAVVTIILAVGTRVLARNRAIVRRLPAVETLGSVSVICTDKTGTLTKNEMTAVRLVLADRELTVSGVGYAPVGGFHLGAEVVNIETSQDVMDLLRCGLLCNDARVLQDASGDWTLVGDPTEGALVTLAHKAALTAADVQKQWPRVDMIPFASERRFMATLHHDHNGHQVLLLKGAPERVLAMCATQAGARPLDVGYWEAAVARAADAGERVLALARAPGNGAMQALADSDLGVRFEMLGLVGLMDPPRDEAITAVEQCRAAGIRVKMVTGDHAATAASIGARLGLRAGAVLTGAVIERLDEQELRARANETDVIARASPEHKLRLVAALQAHGHLVAMTGDGVNDAPALKAADIGVGMGGKGTDAAREAADLVLTDDNFATIARAVCEGRVIYDNIKKSIMFILPTGGGEAGVILLAILAGLPLPVTAGQILWVNTVTAITLGLALAFEPAEHDVMARAPRAAREPLITRLLAVRILFVMGLMVAAAFAIFHWELDRGRSLAASRTAAVNTIVFCEMFYLFNVRHFTAHAFHGEILRGNPQAPLMVGLLVVLQLAFSYAPPLQSLFHTASLDVAAWAAIVSAGGLVFLCVEAEKLLLRGWGVRWL